MGDTGRRPARPTLGQAVSGERLQTRALVLVAPVGPLVRPVPQRVTCDKSWRGEAVLPPLLIPEKVDICPVFSFSPSPHSTK